MIDRDGCLAVALAIIGVDRRVPAADSQPAIARTARVVVGMEYGVGMECRINKVLVHYVEHGSGVPLLALHGAGVDHREMEAAIEAAIPRVGYRRIYPDLPGWAARRPTA